MKLINTYEDREEAEEAEQCLIGVRRLASERDSTVVIYNLFGVPSWGNFHRLKMYRLLELQELLKSRGSWGNADKARHARILEGLVIVEKNYGLIIPSHWC